MTEEAKPVSYQGVPLGIPMLSATGFRDWVHRTFGHGGWEAET